MTTPKGILEIQLKDYTKKMNERIEKRMKAEKDSHERAVAMLKLYLDKNWSLQAIGNKYGITRERVRQILNRFDEYRAFRLSMKEIYAQRK